MITSMKQDSPTKSCKQSVSSEEKDQYEDDHESISIINLDGNFSQQFESIQHANPISDSNLTGHNNISLESKFQGLSFHGSITLPSSHACAESKFDRTSMKYNSRGDTLQNIDFFELSSDLERLIDDESVDDDSIMEGLSFHGSITLPSSQSKFNRTSKKCNSCCNTLQNVDFLELSRD